MALLNVTTGRVHGRYSVGISDDGLGYIPASGTIRFTKSIDYLPAPGAGPDPMMLLGAVRVAVLDAEGYICTPDPANPKAAGVRGIELEATDDTGVSVQDWTWDVEYRFDYVNNVTPKIPPHSIALPGGLDLDLTTVTPVPSAQGNGIALAEASAAAALMAATTSMNAATDAAASASAAEAAAIQAAADAIAPSDAALTTLVNDPESQFNGALSATIGEGMDPPTKQSFLLGIAMRKLRKGLAVTLACRGDSTTYGYDNVSADKVGPSGAADDGSAHAEFRSPAPYPSVLAERLNEVYAGEVTVINQGYSGDSVTRGFDHWPIDRNADVTIISYGINDSRAAWIPEAGDVEAYVRGLEEMILRDLGWGSAVVLLAPFRIRGAAGDTDVDTFASSLNGLASKYGIPIIDGASFLTNAARNAWSDATHLTTKGYGLIGSRLAAAFIGEGPQRPHRVGPGSKLLPRPTVDNFFNVGVSVASNVGYPTPADNVDAQGIAADLKANGTGYWSFYTDVPDVVLYPYFYIQATGGTARFEMDLDFGIEQGSNYNDYAVGESLGFTPPPSTLAREVTGTASYNNSTTNTSQEWLAIRVSTPGWHTVRIRGVATGSVGSLNVQTVELLDSRTFAALKTPAAQSSNPNRLTTGESTLERREISSAGASSGNGTVRLTYFTATKTETITQVRTITGGTFAAGATLARVGVYEVAADGGLTLVASTASDTALWNAGNTTFTKTLSASFTKTVGKRYAVGILVDGTTTAPLFVGATVMTPDEAAQAPRIAGALFGQADLPSSVAGVSVGNTSIQIYAALA